MGARTGIGFGIAFALALAGCTSNTPAPVVGREGMPVASVPAATKARDTYVVKSGDTLYNIAREHGMDYRELIALNAIENPNQIAVGRTLKVRPQAGGASAATATAVTSPVVMAQPIAVEPLVEKRPLAASGNTDMLKREPRAGKEPYSDRALAEAQGQPGVKPEAAPAPTSGAAEKPAETKAPEVGGDEVAWIWPADGKTIGTYSENGSKGVDIAGKAGDPVLAASDGRVVYSGTGLRGYGKLVILKHNNTYLSAYAHNQTILVKEGQSVTKGQKIAEMGSSDADQVKLHFEVRRLGKPVDPMKYLPAR
ncbi:peptidoglycan DD-metalloendopeptidase family protein [Propionivibrio dicarboxylicus]|nr:peptidoglycan DD-metalloendopeptidase family protein [Propionivibrio dicarboxylicus]